VIPLAQIVPARKAGGPRSTDLVPFRFREIGGDILLTNEWGDWIFVTKAELGSLARGEVAPGSPLFERLAERSFLRSRLEVG